MLIYQKRYASLSILKSLSVFSSLLAIVDTVDHVMRAILILNYALREFAILRPNPGKLVRNRLSMFSA